MYAIRSGVEPVEPEESSAGLQDGALSHAASCTAPLLYPASLLLPLHTHRHRCELARAPGGSRAGGRIPPHQFWWDIPKIDCGRANRSEATHAALRVGRAPPRLLGGRGRRLGALRPGADLPTYPIDAAPPQKSADLPYRRG